MAYRECFCAIVNARRSKENSANGSELIVDTGADTDDGLFKDVVNCEGRGVAEIKDGLSSAIYQIHPNIIIMRTKREKGEKK